MYPDNCRYTEEHEWVRREGEVAVVGITAFAAEQLGDITYVELPEVGRSLAQGDEMATVESVKSASDVYAPVMGRVAEANTALDDQPELVNESPYDTGWFVKLEDVDWVEYDVLMDAEAYEEYVSGLEE